MVFCKAALLSGHRCNLVASSEHAAYAAGPPSISDPPKQPGWQSHLLYLSSLSDHAAVLPRRRRFLQFHVRYKCEFGQEVYLVGNCSALGNWDVLEGVQLVWSPGHIWEGSVELPSG
jgi:hypothetical protein